jgi:dsRNA-specific ribonuclease
MAATDEKGVHLGIGTAVTKKQAEQLAAKQAIEKIT